MQKDYYVILGVSRTESPDGIRHAFRELAKKHHPDQVGGDAEVFRALVEAYQVLSNLQTREAYDAQLFRAERPSRRVEVRGVEPLVATRGAEQLEQEPEPDVELVLSPYAALHGARAFVEVPAARPCTRCGTDGFDARGQQCLTCRGVGLVFTREPIELRVPPGRRHGEVLLFPVHRERLCVRILVQESGSLGRKARR